MLREGGMEGVVGVSYLMCLLFFVAAFHSQILECFMSMKKNIINVRASIPF